MVGEVDSEEGVEVKHVCPHRVGVVVPHKEGKVVSSRRVNKV